MNEWGKVKRVLECLRPNTYGEGDGQRGDGEGNMVAVQLGEVDLCSDQTEQSWLAEGPDQPKILRNGVL